MAPVEIYTTRSCSYCHAAKRLLARKGAAFTEIDVSDPSGRSAMIARAGGRTTVPQIFVGTTHLGGCDDLYALDRAGRLEALLGKAAAEPAGAASPNTPELGSAA
jgi:glutaredoxin 3